MLTDVLPAKYRKIAYVVYAVVGAALAAVQTVVATTDGTPQPTWLTVTLAAYGALGTLFGATAASNVQRQDTSWDVAEEDK